VKKRTLLSKKTNSGHYKKSILDAKGDKAIALGYRRSLDSAPRVLAKGSGYLAKQVRFYAEQTDVPVIQDTQLAEGLWNIPVSESIPEQYYKATAEIIMFVYDLQGKI